MSFAFMIDMTIHTSHWLLRECSSVFGYRNLTDVTGINLDPRNSLAAVSGTTQDVHVENRITESMTFTSFRALP